MSSNYISRVLMFAVSAWLSACAVNESTAARVSDMDLKTIKTIYLVAPAVDKYKVAEVIKNDLSKRGYQVSVGPAMPSPYAADVVVTYIDKWMWDLSMFMIELSVAFRNPTNDFPALSGNSLHTSLTRKSPEGMVQEVLDNIFKTK